MPRMRPPLFLLAPILLLATLTSAAMTHRVGILDISGRGDLGPADWDRLNKAVFDEVSASLPQGPWEAVPRQVLRHQVRELGREVEGCLTDECLLGLGKSLGLNLLVVSFFRQTAEEDRVLLKLYDMDSGQMEGFTRVSGSTLGVLFNSLPPSCDRLLNYYRQQAILEEAAVVHMEETAASAEESAAAWQPPEGTESLVGGDSASKDLSVPPPAAGPEHLSLWQGWGLGLMISTYSGPSHAGLLTSINNSMSVMSGGSVDSPFSDFPVSTPVALRLSRRMKPPLTLAATYSLSQYFTNTSFIPHGWDSPRSLETNLHEFTVSLQYALSFVRSETVVPYMGGGVNFVYADSRLAIGLENTPEATVDGDPGSPLLPDQDFVVDSADFSVGAVGFLGIRYSIARRLSLQGELQGQMGQINQYFDYGGSLEHIRPGSEDAGDPSVDDVLWGAYPLDLNGLKLSMGILFEF